MNVKALIPWNRGREVKVHRGDDMIPPFVLRHELNRMFDGAFRSFDLAPFGFDRTFDDMLAWPKLELSENDKEVVVTAELPGLEANDVAVKLANGVLAIKGEKKTETEDKERLFSERYYGRFERRIPIDDIDEEKVSASFRNGVLTVTLPKSAEALKKIRCIAVDSEENPH